MGYQVLQSARLAELQRSATSLAGLRHELIEPLSHIVPMHHELAAAGQRILETRSGVSALQRDSSEPFSHVLALHKEIVSVRQLIGQAVAGLSALQQHDSESGAQLAAMRRELQVLREGETDFQLLMLQQEQLAKFRDLDPEFLALYEACRQFTMTSMARLYSLYQCVEYISGSGIAGDLAECGVWRGGSCMLMAHVLLRKRDTERMIYLYDTYEGHPRPDPDKDIDLWGNRAFAEWQQREAQGMEWGAASLDEVRTNLLSSGYPVDRLAFVKGKVEDTIASNQPTRLALLRLDTDWYNSTKIALEHLYPRIVEGGILIVDDYGHYQGQRQAVDEYFGSIGRKPLLHRIDYSCRVMVKP